MYNVYYGDSISVVKISHLVIFSRYAKCFPASSVKYLMLPDPT